MSQEALPDANDFRKMKQLIHRAFRRAVESVAVWLYYSDVDITIQIRSGKCQNIDWRERDQVTV